MLGNKKSKNTHRLGLKPTLTAQRYETGALRSLACRAIASLAAPVFAVSAWVAMTSSTMAITASYKNDFRVCAGRLLSVGITAQAASQACSESLRPGDLSGCVTRIERQTQIAAPEVLAACSEARRPEQVGNCVVGISRYTRETVTPIALNYCSRSLLPLRFADCVVGLRAEIDFASTQAMESCIDASDKISGYLPSFIPANQQSQPTQFSPTYRSTPAPVESTPTPGVPSQNSPTESTPTTPTDPSQTPANPSSK